MFIPSHSMDTTFLVYDIARDEIIACHTGETGVVPENAVSLIDDSIPALIDAILQNHPEEFKELKKELSQNDLDERDMLTEIVLHVLGGAMPAFDGKKSYIDNFVNGMIDIHGNTITYEIETIKHDTKTPAQLVLEQELMPYCISVESHNDLISFRSTAYTGWSYQYELFDEIIQAYPELLDQLVIPYKPIEPLEPGFGLPAILLKRSDLEKAVARYASKINSSELLEKLENIRRKSLRYLAYSVSRFDDGYLIQLLAEIATDNLPLYRIKPEDDIRKILKKYKKERK